MCIAFLYALAWCFYFGDHLLCFLITTGYFNSQHPLPAGCQGPALLPGEAAFSPLSFFHCPILFILCLICQCRAEITWTLLWSLHHATANVSSGQAELIPLETSFYFRKWRRYHPDLKAIQNQNKCMFIDCWQKKASDKINIFRKEGDRAIILIGNI